MTTWYIKEFAKLTGVSVRTLHHYDKIDLLKPSIRQDNGYRLYSERDLLIQQQILALKFFGFELSQIKELLLKEDELAASLEMQSLFLKEKAKALLDANDLIQKLLSSSGSPPWKSIIELIEVYNMTQDLENTWVVNALSKDELKDYARFEKSLKEESLSSKKEIFDKSWHSLCKEIGENLKEDPTSIIGLDIGARCHEAVLKFYGSEFANVKQAIWEKGFLEGHGDKSDHGLTREMITWLDKAMDAYWHKRLYSILNNVNIASDDVVEALWDEAMEELFGEHVKLKKEFLEKVYTDENISSNAKKWLKERY